MRPTLRLGIVAVIGLLLGVVPAVSEQEGHLGPGSDPVARESLLATYELER